MIRKILIERFSITSSKPFDEVVARVNAAIGHPDMGEFTKATAGARTFAELESAVRKSLGRTSLMLFMELDQGAVLRKEYSQNPPLHRRKSADHEGDGQART